MRKKLNMFIVLLAVCCIMIAASSNVGGKSYADEYVDYGAIFFDYLEDFIKNNPKRECFTSGEAKAAEYLFDAFKCFGYSVKKQYLESYNRTYSEFTAGFEAAANVIARKLSTSATKKTVVLGAHYDSASVGTGSFDNGSGVAILLTVADVLRDVELGFNVEFVAFAAEEEGMLGSLYYVNSLTEAENIMIYYNFDVCVGGEELYVYCEDVSTPQLDYFSEVIKECGAEIETRVDLKPIYAQLTSNAMFTHIGMLSDNQSFKSFGIPTVDFFSGSLDNDFGTYVENSDGSYVMHTERDNMSFFTNNENKVRVQADFLVKTVVKSLTKDDFEYKMNLAIVVSDGFYSGKYPFIAFVVLNIVAFAVVMIINGRNKRDAAFGDVGAKEKDNIFEAPKDDDVFTFRE